VNGKQIWSLGVAAVLLAGCTSKSSTIPLGFQEFRDPDERFMVLYPNTWTFQPGPDQGVKLSDPADASYQITIAKGKVPAQIMLKGKPTPLTSVSQFNRSEFGRRISKSLIPNTGSDANKPTVEIRNERQREDLRKRVYYTYEVVIANNGVARHTLITAVIDQGYLYTVISGSSDDTWASREEKLKTVTDSFQLLPIKPA